MDSDDAMDNIDGPSMDVDGANPSSGKATLKRGDACLACRRRRIRCNAAKPACATCVRLKKQCIYETGKSTSRIAQLKARIAELESQLSAQTPAIAVAPDGRHNSTSSTGSSGIGNPAAHLAPQPAVNGPGPRTSTNGAQHVEQQQQQQQQQGQGYTVNPMTFAMPAFHNPMHSQGQNTPALSGSATTPGFNQSQPISPHTNFAPPPEGNRSGSMPYPKSTGPRPFGEPNPQFDFDLSFLDQPMTDLNSSFFGASVTPMHMGMNRAPEATVVEMSPGQTSSRDERRRESHALADSIMELNSVEGKEPPSMENQHLTRSLLEISQLAGLKTDNPPPALDQSHGSISELVGLRQSSRTENMDDHDTFGLPMLDLEILPQLPQGRELVGGWFDPHDVPSAVRDHLLDLFFSRQNAGDLFHIVFHLPRLYTRLTQVPSKRPHPALMYAMYTTAARLSSQPAIKQLEGQFYSIAEKQIRVAIKAHDRLLDAVRAMALLVSYLFSKEQYSLGYHMTGTAVRLAISCGFDRIPTSVWTPPPPFNAAIHCTLRTGGYAIGPPEDAIDLAERIYAFWAVYEVDLCTAVAYLWHTGLPIEDIRTPLPRPMIEYELGIVSHKDDVPICSVFDSTPPPYPSDSSFLVLRMKALTFLARVLKLRQEKNEVDPPSDHGTAAAAHVCSYPGSAHPAYVTHPAGFAMIKNGLDHFVDSLPAEHKPPWKWDEGEDITLPRVQLARETSVLHFLIGNSYMQLWNVRSLDAENKVALLIARRLVNIMYTFQTEPMSSGYDIFIITIWNEVAMVLVREAKRLQFLGETERAAVIDSDLGVAIAALKKWGDVDVANEHDGADIAAINGKMLDQLRAMGREDWAEAVAESTRRFGDGSGSLGTMPNFKPSGTCHL